MQTRLRPLRCGSSCRITPRDTATQPCVGVSPGRARWKKMALPRPRRRGADVPVEHQAGVVEVVVAPHAFVAGAIGQLDRPVVVAVVRHLAPAERRADRLSAPIRNDAPSVELVPAEIARQHPHAGQAAWRRRLRACRAEMPLRPSAQGKHPCRQQPSRPWRDRQAAARTDQQAQPFRRILQPLPCAHVFCGMIESCGCKSP